MSEYHVPVLYREVLEGLNLKPGHIIVDGTLGGGGHTELILKSNKDIKVIGFDRDIEAIEFCKSRLSKFGKRLEIIHDNFKNLTQVIKSKGIKADGVLLDLGVSSHQIDAEGRGFSFRFDGELDMRMDRDQNLTAKDVVNNYKEEKLVSIFSEYGEERFSKRIARSICANRPINTTGELKQVIQDCVNKINKREVNNSVQRVFQAIRIEVNNELNGLYELILTLAEVLNSGARIAIISFHSLEDRIIKKAYQELATDCICPPKIPVCVCNHRAKAKIINRKPITAKEDELKANSRSSCAKLRVLEIL